MRSNDSIELNSGWETNVVIGYLSCARQSDLSVLNRNRNCMRCVTLNKSVSGSGKRLPVKYDCQMQYGVYMVEADCQPYTDCCFFLSVLIFKSYFENDQLFRHLECGAKISEVTNLKEISDLYSKISKYFEYIYENWLANLGYDLVFYSILKVMELI